MRRRARTHHRNVAEIRSIFIPFDRDAALGIYEVLDELHRPG
jgi:hypothetical protein